ncbi:MAG: hypothetical protein MJ068_00010 [Clostridia bacterium]|nr:hypothetical protein [Clostridia bacterium]
MAKVQYSDNDKKLWIGIGISALFLIFGFLFLFNAMGVANFYPHFAAIDNALGKYIVVILTFTCGIMGWSNVALRFEDEKTRKGLTIAMTTFAFIMTLPLTFVFFSLLAVKANYTALEISQAGGFDTVVSSMAPKLVESSADVLGLNAVDKIMGTHNIYLGFVDWFGEGGLLWAVLVIMSILGVVFLLEPLFAGICVCKGKILNLFGKNDAGKFGVVRIATLPVILKQQKAAAEASETTEDKE